MTFWLIVAILVGLFILLYGIEKILIRLFDIEKGRITETSGKKVFNWGRGILLIISLILLWFVIDIDSSTLTKFYGMVYITLLLGFEAIMQYIFLRKSRQYISTTIILILGLVIMYNIDKFPFWGAS